MIGKAVRHYHIIEKLGEGGMGVVYKALDTHLDRSVAIKVLPPKAISDPERKRRFVQEAKAASALNHPNIIHIYDIDQSDGVDFIAMEYIQGKRLDEIVGKGLKTGEALKYAIQISDALAASHAAGIIHRDLKPANVMISDQGLVKVLDFGLAKLVESAQSNASASTQTMSPITEQGAIIGTVTYMSPEQAEGKQVDARSDIFSFGSVLYEMVTGRKAFEGESKVSTLAAILNKDPEPASQIVQDLPPELERVVTRCLRKDADRRFQHMIDVKIALQELKEDSDSGRLSATLPARSSGVHKWIWISTVIAVLIIAAAILLFRPVSETPQVPMKAVPLTSLPGSELNPTLSPDGTQVAFAWNGEKQNNYHIYLKQVGLGAPRALTSGDSTDADPVWSPDGNWIAYFRFYPDGKAELWKMPALGGDGVVLAASKSGLGPPPEGLQKRFIAWSPDSRWIALANGNPKGMGGIGLISVVTGERRGVTGVPDDMFPAFSPDGKALAFTRQSSNFVSEIYLLSLADDLKPAGEPKRLTFDDRATASPVWTSDGREIIFSSGEFESSRSFWRIPVSGSSKGAKQILGIGDDAQVIAISHKASLTPRLVYARQISDINIWGMDLQKPDQRFKIIDSTRSDIHPHYSPDGQKIVFVSSRSGNCELWVSNADGSNAVQLTSFGRGYVYSPRWSPDGDRIAFAAHINQTEGVYIIGSNGGPPERLTGVVRSVGPVSFSADGRWIYGSIMESGPNYELWKIATDRQNSARKITNGGGFNSASDGKFLYFTKSFFPVDLWRVPIDPEGDPAGAESKIVTSLQNYTTFAVTAGDLYFIQTAGVDGNAPLSFLDNKSGRIQEIAKIPARLHEGFTVSIDRRRILWTQLDRLENDLYLVDNFH